MSGSLDLPRLAGTHVVLAPLQLDNLEGLKAAVADGELWKLWSTARSLA